MGEVQPSLRLPSAINEAERWSQPSYFLILLLYVFSTLLPIATLRQSLLLLLLQLLQQRLSEHCR